MDFEGTMKVNDAWQGHFQLELNKQYTNASWDGEGFSKDDVKNDGTIQRAWVTGKIGNVGVTAGKKWWGLGSQCVLFGHAGSGVQLDVPVGDKFTFSAFNIRPSQGGLMSSALADPGNTSLYGAAIGGEIAKGVTMNIIAGGNHKTGDAVTYEATKNPVAIIDAAGNTYYADLYTKKVTKDTGVTNWQAVDLSYKISNDWKITGTYTKTNADNCNKSGEVRLDYKAADLNKAGSYDAYFRYVHFGKYGDISHDDEWSSLPGDMKGWIIGVDWVVAKNIQWTNLYSDQKLSISDSTDQKRKLFRTEFDFHF
jgi:hypothetical protein